MTTSLHHAAVKIGRKLVEWAGEGKFAGRSVGTQFKAEVDRWADELWRTEIEGIEPGAVVMSEEEETSHRVARTRPYWVVDPLDGTASYVGGFTGWVTQAARMENGRPTTAVVYAPQLDLLFSAQAGQGAFCNSARLTLGSRTLGALTDNYPEPRGIAAAVIAAFAIPRYIESGSIGLKICRVASGEADLFIKDVVVRNWDVAPGHLILTEAGGELATLSGLGWDYSGSVEHEGLIAAAAARQVRQVAEWASVWRNAKASGASC